MERFKATTYGLAAALGLALAGASPGASVVSDTTFNNADWSSTTTLLSGGASYTAGQFNDGGNLVRQVVHNISGGGGMQVHHLYEAQTYDPSTQGAITSLGYTEAASVSGALVGRQLAVRQGGYLYVENVDNTADTAGSYLPWQETQIVESQFGAIDGGPGLDFSSSGGPITFGFMTFNSTGGSLNYTLNVDDFQYTVWNEPIATVEDWADTDLSDFTISEVDMNGGSWNYSVDTANNKIDFAGVTGHSTATTANAAIIMEKPIVNGVGDFTFTTNIAWDVTGNTQSWGNFYVMLRDADGDIVARAGIGDSWINTGSLPGGDRPGTLYASTGAGAGGQVAIGGGTPGADSLDPSGTVEVDIQRVGDRIIISFDNEIVVDSIGAANLDEIVELEINTTQYIRSGYPTSTAPDYSVYGMEFQSAVIPEPASVFLLGLGGLALLRRR